MIGKLFESKNVLFRQSLNSEIYVDKTELIHFTNKILNTENNLICVSRPRWFSKSMAQEMLATYYSKGCDSKELVSASVMIRILIKGIRSIPVRLSGL